MAKHNSRGPWGNPERLKRIRTRGHFTHRPPPVCSQCSAVLDDWTALEPGTEPRPSGSGERHISICAECGTLHEFVGNPRRLRLQRLEGEELVLALAHPTIKKARGLIMMERAVHEQL
jgi:hypothetical protein